MHCMCREVQWFVMHQLPEPHSVTLSELLHGRKMKIRWKGSWAEIKRESPYCHKQNLGVLVDSKLDMNQQCPLTAENTSYILGCIKRGAANRERELTVLFCSALGRETPCAQLHPGMGPPAQKKTGSCWSGSRGGPLR